MSWLAPGLLGLVFGSFLNVVIHRVPRRKSIVYPASHCPSCRKPIEWYDNIPVASYVALRGRCRRCKKKISIRYPVIEALTALLLLAARARHGLDLTMIVRDVPFILMLVAVTFIDLDHRIIPNVISLPGTALGLLTSFLDPRLGAETLLTFGFFDPPSSEALTAALRSIEGGLLGFGLFYGLGWTYERLTGRYGLGGGDVKLLALIGTFLGPMGVLTTVLVSSVFGSVVGIGWALATRQKNLMTSAIPYGPFLVIGALYYYLFGQ
ncbi:MAG TPA: prepilin peptidase [Bdellovibrionota bacterium]|nr:prepilin peptidase [Bdellovibrionota bacterium]